MNDAKFRGGTPGAPRAGLARGGRPAETAAAIPYSRGGAGGPASARRRRADSMRQVSPVEALTGLMSSPKEKRRAFFYGFSKTCGTRSPEYLSPRRH